jgi:hypothetical protein
MSEVSVQKLSPQRAVSAVLRQPNQKRIEDATACFATDFGIRITALDWSLGKKNVWRNFQKTRERYPDSSLQTDRILVSGDYVITEWTLRYKLTEPFYGGLSRKVPISLHGASIVRIENGKITDWADYYDGLTSRRTALGAHEIYHGGKTKQIRAGLEVVLSLGAINTPRS